jgi:hypothetical protein
LRARIAIDFGEDIAEDIRYGEEQHTGAEGNHAQQRQIQLRDLCRADQIGADQHDDEGGHDQLVIAVVSRPVDGLLHRQP